MRKNLIVFFILTIRRKNIKHHLNINKLIKSPLFTDLTWERVGVQGAKKRLIKI